MTQPYRVNSAILGVPMGYRRISDFAAARGLDQGLGKLPTNVTGVSLLYTDSLRDVPLEARGSLVFTFAGTLLAWKAPGDTVAGAGVNVGGGGNFTLTSGSAGKQLYVTVVGGSLPGSDQSDVDIVAGLPKGCSIARFSAETQAVRWRDDGIAPTATLGMPLAVGSEVEYRGDDLGKLKLFQQAATAILNIVLFG